MRVSLFLAAYCFFGVLQTSIASKLNVRRLLLPFNLGVATNYTLEVSDGGCYNWSSSRPHVADVIPIYESVGDSRSCSRRAIVTVAYQSPKRQSTVIIASDSSSDETIRTDVVVDVIKSIEIVTTTKEIALEDVPEIFEVHAKNDENDTFTYLGGIEFEWTFEPIVVDGGNEVMNNLRFRKFVDSHYDVPEAMKFWESKESHGQQVLVQGIKTGASYIRARIVDSFYKSVPQAETTLVVIANLMLIPSHDIYLIPNANIKYAVNMIRSGRTQQIPIPSEQYFFELSDSNVASLNEQSSVVTALKEGSTSIILKDKNIKPGGGIRQPTSEIHIRKPSYLLFDVEPGHNWALQEFTVYLITVNIFDEYHHKMYPSENLELKVSFPSTYFHVNFATKNGTYYVVKTLNPGVTKLKGELIGTRMDDGTINKFSSSVTAEQDVHIYEKLRVVPPLILLPWDPVEKPSYTVYPKAVGATGVYHWESSNTEIASVMFREGKSSSKATVVTRGMGEALLTVVDTNNQVSKTTARVSIQPIIDMDIGHTIFETVVGSSVILPLLLYGYESKENKVRKTFDDCSKIPISVDIVERTRFVYVESDEEGHGILNSCRSLRFDCKNVGHSRIWVKYSTANGKINLNTTTVISCHLPLKLVHPQTLGLLALGSSVELTFEGGPRPWPLNRDGYYTRLQPTVPSLFSMSPITDPYRYKKDLHVFRVVCKDIGESDVELAVGNLESPTLPNPAVQKANVKLICGVPSKLFLRPKLKSEEHCPIGNNVASSSALKIPVSSSRNTEIELFAKDSAGRLFLNMSSLQVVWKLSDSSYGKLESVQDFVEEVNGAHGYRRWNRNFQSFHPLKREGEVVVDARIEGYKKTVLKHEGIISFFDLSDGISTKVTLTLVDKPTIDPEEVTILNHPNNKVNLQISKGSGHFDIDVSSPEFANITYSETSKRIELVPQKDGILTIKITDNCVEHGSGAADATTSLRIVNAREIRVSVPDKVEAGREVDIKVQLIDTRGETIPSNFHRLMNLHPVTVSDVISVKPKTFSKPVDSVHSLFTLKAEKIGRTSLLFKTGASKSTEYDKVITSQEIIIQVFMPLRIVPSAVTLIVGSIFQVTVSGGPQPEGLVVYGIENDSVASVSSSGMINSKKIGSTKVSAKAIGPNVVYSEDSVTINVIALDSIKIMAPSQQLLIAEEMPLFLYSVLPNSKKSFSPFTFGSANPYLKIHWSVSNKDVAQLKTLYEDFGLPEHISGQKDSPNIFAVRLRGLQSGVINIRVVVEVTKEAISSYDYQVKNNKMLVDEIQVRVFPPLDLTVGVTNKPSGLILMSPGSELVLKTTRNGFARISHSLKTSTSKILIEKGNVLKAEETDETIVEIKAHEEFGVTQTSTFRVRVKPVTYLMINTVNKIATSQETDHNVVDVPVGFSIKLQVTFHDAVGKRFDAVNSNIKVRPSRFDLINILFNGDESNTTLTVRALKQGLTVLRIWDSQSVSGKLLEDYIYIRTGHVIYPNEPQLRLAIGDIVCFTSSLRTSEGQSGTWEVDGDSESVFVDPLSGVAVARRSGEVKVKYNLDSFNTISAPVSVSIPEMVLLDTNAAAFLTNSASQMSKTVIIPIVISSETSLSKSYCPEDKAKEYYNQQPLFECQLMFTSVLNTPLETIGRDLKASDVFNCDVTFSFERKRYEVLIALKEEMSEPQYTLPLSTVETNITVFVNFLLLGIDMQSFEQTLPLTLTVPFYPAFHVSQDEVILSNSKPLTYVTVTGTPDILRSLHTTVNEDTSKVISIFPPELSQTNQNLVNIPIQINDVRWLWQRDSDAPLSIRLSSTLSRQFKIIPVKIKWSADGPNCPTLPRQSLISGTNFVWSLMSNVLSFLIDYYQILLTSISTCAVMFVGYHWLVRYSNRQSVPFLQPHNLSPSTSFVSTRFGGGSSPELSSGRRILSYASPTSLSGNSPDRPSSPTSPGVRTPVRPLWTIRNS
ncbi:nuclear pore membrane glycoprotein 210-like protein [Leptotrombidium deliense]|uniref:Nuclear pore membrane glycoprotein 210-like protein n=1 Tax=Leptotrombidium deliense TaxID=299467 RepID=A0A443SP59_9ACAR|nr:nuclear pore membrane glycoprotein 210-like protein [Leptotrombidium deliense]